MRIIQISDTHHSAVHPDFAANVATITAEIEALPCDLLVGTGDLSMNGAGDEADLDAAEGWRDALAHPFVGLPGNHDVGDLAEFRSDQVVDDGRLEAYRARFGEDRWVRDQGGWRLVGLNAMLCGTGHPEEARQVEWFAGALDTTAPVALFLHKPLFVDDADEPAFGYWTIAPEPRRRLLDLMARADVRLVASGHLHSARRARFGDTDHVWCPAASFVCGPIQQGVPGERRPGYAVHEFGPAAVESRIVFPVGAETLPIDPVLRRIYPPPGAASDAAA